MKWAYLEITSEYLICFKRNILYSMIHVKIWDKNSLHIGNQREGRTFCFIFSSAERRSFEFVSIKFLKSRST
jgi:hypothetical protein